MCGKRNFFRLNILTCGNKLDFAARWWLEWKKPGFKFQCFDETVLWLDGLSHSKVTLAQERNMLALARFPKLISGAVSVIDWLQHWVILREVLRCMVTPSPRWSTGMENHLSLLCSETTGWFAGKAQSSIPKSSFLTKQWQWREEPASGWCQSCLECQKKEKFSLKKRGIFSFSWKTEGGPVVWQKAAWTPLVGG